MDHLTLPLEPHKTYIDNDGTYVYLIHREEYDDCLYSAYTELWYNICDGVAECTEFKLVEDASPATLPLDYNKRYITNRSEEITFKEKAKNGNFKASNGYWFNPKTGKAPNTGYFVIAEVLVDEIKELHSKRDAMMQRLKEIGAC